MNSEIRFYLSLFLKRLPLFVVVVSFFSAGAVALAFLLPAVFRSEALMLIESPQIPTNLAISTVQTNPLEQLQIIEQQLLTRANLIDIANKIDVYPNRNEMSADEVVEQMRDDTGFDPSTGRNSATLFRVSFRAWRADVAAQVANEYVSRILADNVELRTGRAEQTLEFFQQEVERLGAELDLQSARILEFENANLDALPSSLSFRLTRQSSLQTRLSDISRQRTGLVAQRDRIIEVFNATGSVQPGAGGAQTPLQNRLDTLNTDLSRALAIYSEQNPRVRLLRAEIANTEKQIAAAAAALAAQPANTTQQSDPVLDAQLAPIDAQILTLDDEQKVVEQELADLEATIAATPANQIALDALNRDYSNIQGQYNTAKDRLSAAATGERIELLSKGQRITVLRQPIVPREPYSPNRLLIAVGGIAASIGIAGGLIALLELMDRSLRRPVDLTKRLGITPLATLPYVRTRRESFKRRTVYLLVLIGVLVGVPSALYYVHVEYQPLDLVFENTIAKLGL